jgi:hypothetical protein
LRRAREVIGESEGGTEIVPVVVVRKFARIRRVRSDELEHSLVGSKTRIHPAAEISSGNTERRAAAADCSRGQADGRERYAVPVITDSEIERKVLRDLVVVLEEEIEFPYFFGRLSAVRRAFALRVGGAER